jgi:hypothetical protein
MQQRVADFNLDATRWVVAGSDAYTSTMPVYPDFPFENPTRTLRISDDQGLTWDLVTSGDFNYMADLVVYGNGVWIAGGRHYMTVDGLDGIYYGLRSSTDGLVWTTITLPGALYPTTITNIAPPGDPPVSASMTLESIAFDGASYIAVVATNLDGSISQTIFTHPADGSDLTTGWTTLAAETLSGLPGGEDVVNPRVSRLKGRFVVADAPPSAVLSFPDQGGTGPTVTSPTESAFLLYQYVAMTPIEFSATGVGTTFFFVLDSDLPLGLTFNVTTNTLSGTPMTLGESSLIVYAKDDEGVTEIPIAIRVVLATVTRQQTSAGAWTALTRQYTLVNAAQNALNARTLPATQPPLGSFMRPTPPDSVTAPGNPNCRDAC